VSQPSHGSRLPSCDGAVIATLDRCRLAGFRPNSRLSHRRMVSRPTSMPIKRKPPTSDSADSPAWCRRNSSSWCDSSCAVAWLRGCLAWATAWANVVGGGGFDGEYPDSDMVANEAQYACRPGIARGAPRAHSKRKRLDVGVLYYCFVLLFWGEAGFFLGSLIGWLIELVDCLVFVRGVFVEWVYLSRWIPGFVGQFLDGFSRGSGLVVGGGGC